MARCDMHQAGILHRNKVCGHDPVCNLALERDLLRERGFVLPASQFRTFLCFQCLELLVPPFFQHRLDERFRHPEVFLAAIFFCTDSCVDKILCHRDRDIGRERPWRRRPYDQVLVCLSPDRELHKDRGVGLVPVFNFGIRDRRFAPGAPVHDPVPAFQHPFLIGPCKGPPRCLHVSRCDCLVCVFEVQPDPQALELGVHQFLVFYGKFPALLDKTPDPERLDILF